MISVTNLKSGVIFEDEGQIFKVLSYEHIKMGRGSANIKVRVENLRSGATLEKTFQNGAKVAELLVFKRELQFLYKDNESAYFMAPTTFEQILIPLKIMGSDSAYLKEGENFNISFLENEALSVNLPPKMTLKVVETPPGVKGNSATNVFKDAILENGLNVKVPLFIKNGDRIILDTRTNSYTQRA